MSAMGSFESRLIALERKARGADWRISQLEIAAGKAAAQQLNQAWVLPSGCQAWLYVYVNDGNTGAAIDGATVQLFSGGLLLGTAITNADGQASFVFSSALTGLSLDVSANDYYENTASGLSVACGTATTSNVTLGPTSGHLFTPCPGRSFGDTATVNDSVYGVTTLTSVPGGWSGCKIVNYPGSGPSLGNCPAVQTPIFYGLNQNGTFAINYVVVNALTNLCPRQFTVCDPTQAYFFGAATVSPSSVSCSPMVATYSIRHVIYGDFNLHQVTVTIP